MQEHLVLNLKFKIPTGVVSRRNSDGNVVVMNYEDDSKLYKLSGLCADVWDCAEKVNTVHDLVGKIFDDYELPKERFYEDLDRFLKQMQTYGLLELS